MYVSKNGARVVGGRLRRAAWVFGLFALFLFGYLGAYRVAVLAGAGCWVIFRVVAYAVERAGGGGGGRMSNRSSKERRC